MICCFVVDINSQMATKYSKTTLSYDVASAHNAWLLAFNIMKLSLTFKFSINP